MANGNSRHGGESSNDTGCVNKGVNRRSILRRAAGATAAGGLIGTIGSGSVIASQSDCTGNKNLSEFSDYANADEDSKRAENGCDGSLSPPFSRLDHYSSLIYQGTYNSYPGYSHIFLASGHAENWGKDACSQDWSRHPGLTQHGSKWMLHESNLVIAKQADAFVKAAPDGGQGSEPWKWLDQAYTGMTLAVGASNPVLGTGMGLAGALQDWVDSAIEDPSNSLYDLEYIWGENNGYWNNDPICSSHFVRQEIEDLTERPADGSFDITYVDTAWGQPPNITEIYFNISTNDPVMGSSVNSHDNGDDPNNSETLPMQDNPAVPEEGDVTTTSRGYNMHVTDVTYSEPTVSEGGREQLISIDDAPRRVRERSDKSKIEYIKYPTIITTATVSGRLVD